MITYETRPKPSAPTATEHRFRCECGVFGGWLATPTAAAHHAAGHAAKHVRRALKILGHEVAR